MQASADALFQGCGFVPDIPTLQAWLECAWKAGIDTAGGDLLGNTIQGSKHWIGTTECATVLRLSGFKAQVVDFTGAIADIRDLASVQISAYPKHCHVATAHWVVYTGRATVTKRNSSASCWSSCC